jgi:hypothetical protein
MGRKLLFDTSQRLHWTKFFTVGAVPKPRQVSEEACFMPFQTPARATTTQIKVI